MDEYPKHLKALLDEARSASQPNAPDRARIHDALGKTLSKHGFDLRGAPIPESSLHTAPAPSAAPAAALPAGGGLVLCVVAAAALITGVVKLWPQPTPRAPAVALGSSPVVVAAAAPAAMPAATSAPNRVIPEPGPVAAVSPPAAALPMETRVATLMRPPRAAVRRGRVASAHATVSKTTAPAATPAPAPAPTSTSTPTQSSTPAPVLAAAVHEVESSAPAATVAGTSPHHGLAEEIELIAAARREVQSGDAKAALLHLDLHRQRFGDGALADERRGLRVLALCALGPSAEALTARERFLTHAPNALLTEQVSAACAPNAAQRRRP